MKHFDILLERYPLLEVLYFVQLTIIPIQLTVCYPKLPIHGLFFPIENTYHIHDNFASWQNHFLIIEKFQFETIFLAEQFYLLPR